MSGWLTLTRKRGELVRAGDVLIYVGRISEEQVRISIHAPKDVRIDRGERPGADHDGLITRATSNADNAEETP